MVTDCCAYYFVGPYARYFEIAEDWNYAAAATATAIATIVTNISQFNFGQSSIFKLNFTNYYWVMYIHSAYLDLLFSICFHHFFTTTDANELFALLDWVNELFWTLVPLNDKGYSIQNQFCVDYHLPHLLSHYFDDFVITFCPQGTINHFDF